MLSTDLYLPTGPGPFPTALCRTPYDNQSPYYVEWARRFAAAGYAVALQDCRGRYDSDGVWGPYVDEGEDGFDAIEWLVAQPWCNGRVATFGFSYVGFNQLLAAAECPSGLQATVPIGNQEDNYGHIWCDGVLQLEAAANFFRLGRRSMQERAAEYVDINAIYRTLPLERALDPVGRNEHYLEFIEHPTFDEYWRRVSLKGRYGLIEAPALIVTGWYDNLVHEMFKVFSGIRESGGSELARELTKIVVGPWTHYHLGEQVITGVDFGPNARLDLPDLHLDWYAARLKDEVSAIDDQPPIRIFLMGRNEWITASTWPVEGTEWRSFYLHGAGDAHLAGRYGTLSTTMAELEPPDEFEYDPHDPVPTLGGYSQFDGGPRDRAAIHSREDVLVYATEPLEQDVDVVGPVRAVLYASTTGDDTDFTAALIDLDANGVARIVCEGIVRGRFRGGYASEEPLVPETIYEFNISLWETANRFMRGHRIVLEISSSNFPRFNRSLNVFSPIATGYDAPPASQRILHETSHPSRLILPILPE